MKVGNLSEFEEDGKRMDDKKVYIIAEAGVNHNGSLELAKKLIDVAVEAGADAVKFQTFKTECLVCESAQKADYQKLTTSKDESQFSMLKKLELTYNMHKELIDYCNQKSIQFLFTPFDIESINMLEKLNVQCYKVPSGEITNFPYLREIGSKKKKIILSTGMSTLNEISEAIAILRKYGANDIAVLHCNTQYPTPMKDVNLKAIPMMAQKLKVPVGYSDHTKGIEVPIAAVALGASIIEKHFTLDCSMEGPDHKASMEPEELRTMVRAIRNIEKALGVAEKVISESEKDNMNIVRKSIVASRSIVKGEMFSEDNLTAKRPGNGISPMKWDEVLGKKASRNFEKDEQIIIC